MAFLLVFWFLSLGRLKTMPTFALEKQTRLQWKQTSFILMLPAVSAVAATQKARKVHKEGSNIECAAVSNPYSLVTMVSQSCTLQGAIVGK